MEISNTEKTENPNIYGDQSSAPFHKNSYEKEFRYHVKDKADDSAGIRVMDIVLGEFPMTQRRLRRAVLYHGNTPAAPHGHAGHRHPPKPPVYPTVSPGRNRPPPPPPMIDRSHGPPNAHLTQQKPYTSAPKYQEQPSLNQPEVGHQSAQHPEPTSTIQRNHPVVHNPAERRQPSPIPNQTALNRRRNYHEVLQSGSSRIHKTVFNKRTYDLTPTNTKTAAISEALTGTQFVSNPRTPLETPKPARPPPSQQNGGWTAFPEVQAPRVEVPPPTYEQSHQVQHAHAQWEQPHEVTPPAPVYANPAPPARQEAPRPPQEMTYPPQGDIGPPVAPAKPSHPVREAGESHKEFMHNDPALDLGQLLDTAPPQHGHGHEPGLFTHEPMHGHDAVGHGHDTGTHGHEAGVHGHEAAGHGHEAAVHGYEAPIHGHEVTAHGHEAVGHGHEAAGHGHEAAAHGHEAATNGHEAVGNGHEAGVHGHEAANNAHDHIAHHEHSAPQQNEHAVTNAHDPVAPHPHDAVPQPPDDNLTHAAEQAHHAPNPHIPSEVAAKSSPPTSAQRPTQRKRQNFNQRNQNKRRLRQQRQRPGKWVPAPQQQGKPAGPPPTQQNPAASPIVNNAAIQNQSPVNEPSTAELSVQLESQFMTMFDSWFQEKFQTSTRSPAVVRPGVITGTPVVLKPVIPNPNAAIKGEDLRAQLLKPNGKRPVQNVQPKAPSSGSSSPHDPVNKAALFNEFMTMFKTKFKDTVQASPDLAPQQVPAVTMAATQPPPRTPPPQPKRNHNYVLTRAPKPPQSATTKSPTQAPGFTTPAPIPTLVTTVLAPVDAEAVPTTLAPPKRVRATRAPSTAPPTIDPDLLSDINEARSYQGLPPLQPHQVDLRGNVKPYFRSLINGGRLPSNNMFSHGLHSHAGSHSHGYGQQDSIHAHHDAIHREAGHNLTPALHREIHRLLRQKGRSQRRNLFGIIPTRAPAPNQMIDPDLMADIMEAAQAGGVGAFGR